MLTEHGWIRPLDLALDRRGSPKRPQIERLKREKKPIFVSYNIQNEEKTHFFARKFVYIKKKY